jgi:hypothetical protein
MIHVFLSEGWSEGGDAGACFFVVGEKLNFFSGSVAEELAIQPLGLGLRNRSSHPTSKIYIHSAYILWCLIMPQRGYTFVIRGVFNGHAALQNLCSK